MCFQFTLILMSWSQKQGPAFDSRCFVKRVWCFTLWISMKPFRCTTYDITPTAAVWSFIRLIFLSSRRCHVVLRNGKWQFWGQKTCSAVWRFHLKCVQEQLVLIVPSDVFIKMFWWVTKWQHCSCLGNLELRGPFEIFHFELGKRHQLLRKDDEG